MEASDGASAQQVIIDIIDSDKEHAASLLQQLREMSQTQAPDAQVAAHTSNLEQIYQELQNASTSAHQATMDYSHSVLESVSASHAKFEQFLKQMQAQQDHLGTDLSLAKKQLEEASAQYNEALRIIAESMKKQQEVSRTIPRWALGTGAAGIVIIGVTGGLMLGGVIPSPWRAEGSVETEQDPTLASEGIAEACSLLTTAEASIYAGDVVEVHGSEPKPESLDSHDCHWWDATGEGFSVVLSYGGAWDFSVYEDPEWMTDIVEFDGLPYESVLHMPNDYQLQFGHVPPDLVKAVEVRKGQHIALFYGRQQVTTLTLGSTELDRFLEVVEIAMSRLP